MKVGLLYVPLKPFRKKRFTNTHQINLVCFYDTVISCFRYNTLACYDVKFFENGISSSIVDEPVDSWTIVTLRLLKKSKLGQILCVTSILKSQNGSASLLVTILDVTFFPCTNKKMGASQKRIIHLYRHRPHLYNVRRMVKFHMYKIKSFLAKGTQLKW